jgi:hypothetical protein
MMETKILMYILFFLAFVGFINTIMPKEYQFLNAFDMVWFSGGIVGVAGSCAVATGLICAAALAIFGLTSMLAYIVFSLGWIKLLMMPVVVIIAYIVMRLARGGG